MGNARNIVLGAMLLATTSIWGQSRVETDRQREMREAREASEKRRQEEHTQRMNQRQLERDRAELCRLETINYGRPVSCPETTTATTTTVIDRTQTGAPRVTTTRSTNR